MSSIAYSGGSITCVQMEHSLRAPGLQVTPSVERRGIAGQGVRLGAARSEQTVVTAVILVANASTMGTLRNTLRGLQGSFVSITDDHGLTFNNHLVVYVEDDGGKTISHGVGLAASATKQLTVQLTVLYPYGS